MDASRRNILAAAVGAASAIALGSVAAQSQESRAKGPRNRDSPHYSFIDVHSHIAPPAWVQELARRRLTSPQVVSPELTRGWSIQKQIEDMEVAGVSKTINSVTMPGVWFDDVEAARRLARECNEYGARLKESYPNKLGMFAMLPLPDVEGSLREIAYALDVLKADGIHLFTSYEDVWLGDPKLAEILQELDNRRALIHVHPTVAVCCRNLIPGIGVASIEVETDTARAIAKYVFSGSSQRFRKLRVIFSHGGGTMPILIGRFELLASQAVEGNVKLPSGFATEARKFYYDTAQIGNKPALASLKALIPSSRILFGTDYPIRQKSESIETLISCGMFDRRELSAISHGNFEAMLRSTGNPLS